MDEATTEKSVNQEETYDRIEAPLGVQNLERVLRENVKITTESAADFPL